MIKWYKKRGETPLQSLERFRLECPEYQYEILSYAGRLDPMAEGILPILIGKEENKNRQKFLNKDKEYHAEFMLGCSTDTGDILGIIQKIDFKKIEPQDIVKVFENMIEIKTQTYPWYSSKTVDGKALFEYAREGKFDIERPKRNIQIYQVQDIRIQEEPSKKLIEQYVEDIQSVKGDFRQEEIVRKWRNINDHPRQVQGDNSLSCDTLQIISCTLTVSSGTYIRALCEYIEDILGVPAVLVSLIRTQIF